MKIIIPAYNVKADQATKFEAQIAAIMHMKRDEEINRFQENKAPPKEGRSMPPIGKARLPDNDTRKTAITQGRENNSTDEIILKMLRRQSMPMSIIADTLNLSKDTVRHALSRMVARRMVTKELRGYTIWWHAIGRQEEVQMNER